jgi:hypothetical protein
MNSMVDLSSTLCCCWIAPLVASFAEGVRVVGGVDGWVLLLHSLADTITAQRAREPVVSVACNTFLALLQDSHGVWGSAAWEAALGPAMAAAFCVPADRAALPNPATAGPLTTALSIGGGGGGGGGNGRRASSGEGGPPTPEFVSRAQSLFPQFAAQVGRAGAEEGQQLLDRLAATALYWLMHVSDARVRAWGWGGVEGRGLLCTHVPAQVQAAWGVCLIGLMLRLRYLLSQG